MLYSKIPTLNNKPLKEDLPKKIENKNKMLKCCCLRWSMRLATPSWFVGMPLKLKET